MALSNKALQSVNSLDFDTIKRDFIAYLTSQDTFKDYNFEGSGMSVLLDILAYNTHHMGFYANMLANESFLDSCVLRSSAVSLSKSTGYSPRSRRGAEILIDVRLSDSSNDPDTITKVNSRFYRVLKNDVFSCDFGGTLYYFYAVNTVYFEYEGKDSSGNDLFYARNVLLREGRLKSRTFTVNNSYGEDQRFIIPDINLDDRSVDVFVRKSVTESEGSTDPWFRSTSIINNTSESRVFFLQEVYDGKYEVYFGDGVVGRPVDQGNVIIVTYASCSGTDANGIGSSDSASSRTFTYISSLNDEANITYEPSVVRDDDENPIVSYGGQEKESKASIKYYAPRLYETQDRAVTLNDYVTLLQSNYSGSIRSVHAWGGEDNDPPEYGKVFVSIRPISGLFLTIQEKLNIEESMLSDKNIVTVTPKVIDPDYLYISPTLNVKYDPRETTKSVQSLQNAVLIYVKQYGIDNLSAFEKNFFSGQMIKNITDLDASFKSCTVNILFNKIIYPVFNTKISYSINFENKLSEISSGVYVQSSVFLTYGNSSNANNLPSVRAYFKDNGKGKISLYDYSTQKIITDEFGTVNYDTGLVRINSAQFLLESSLEKYEVSVSSRPFDNDVFSRRNTILEMNQSEITVTMTPVSTVRI